MHNKAGATAKNRVELVLARNREAGVASLFEADKLFVPEIPATRALIQVATYCALIPDLRGAYLHRRRVNGWIHSRHLFVLSQVDNLHGRAYMQPTVNRRHGGIQGSLHVNNS